MKITFPHMGNTFIVVKTLLDSLGLDYVIPPPVSKRDLEIGIKYCPEMACIPLKINIGNFVQAIEQGADTILMVGGFGPCRLGYYVEMHREILHDNGFNVDVVGLEISRGRIKEFIGNVRKLSNNRGLGGVLKAVIKAIDVANEVDKLENLVLTTRPRELNKGESDAIYLEFLREVVNVDGAKQIKELINDTVEKLKKVKIDKEFKPIKVGIVGEIYSIIEPFTNFNIEKKLGDMGIEVERSLTVGGWIKEHVVNNALLSEKGEEYKKAAKPFLGTMIGGHAQATVGNSVLFSNKGYDGIIQIYPLNCMPEIVADSILPEVSKKFDTPILTLIIDEMSGEEGLKTRLEAFLDLLISRRERKETDEKWLLSWD